MIGPDDDDDPPEQRPEDLPDQVNAADPKEHRKRRRKAAYVASQQERFLRKLLADPEGRAFLWGILEGAHTFDLRWGFTPGGTNADGSWYFRGQQDLGLSLYHRWSVLDRAGVLAMMDEFHPGFKKGSK